MKSMDMGSIGKNLSLLVLIAILPALAIFLYTGLEQRQQSIGQAKEQLLLITHTMAEVQIDIARSARQILSTLAMLPEVNSLDTKNCDTIFKAVLGQNPNFQNIALTDLQGEVLASGLPFSPSNLKDRKHFQRALEQRAFSIGEYIISRVGNTVPAIAFAYPVLDTRNKPRAVLTTVISLARFSRFYNDLNLYKNSFIAITDSQGIRLLYYPPREKTNPLGKAIQRKQWETCSQAQTPGIFMDRGSDGISRIFAHRQVQLSPGTKPDFCMWAGIPESQILGPANAILARNLLLMLVVAASALLGSWRIGKKTLISPIRELISVAGKFAKGDLEVPKKPAFTSGELGTLTRAFHDMARNLAINQKNLQQNEARFRLLMNSLDAVVYVKDMDTHEILFINEYGEKNRLNDLGEFLEQHSREFQDAATGHWYFIRNRVIKWIDGRWARLEIATDITELKKAESKIAEEKERLAVTLKSIGDGVITTDTQSRILLMNAAAEALTDWSASQAAGRPLTDIFNIVDSKTEQSCKNSVEKVLASGQKIGLAPPITLISKKGVKRTIADNAAPIRDKQGNVIGVILVFRDVTEQLRTEQELMKIKKLESIGVLAGGVAHDYNNILTAILGYIQLSLMDSNLTVKTQNFLEQAMAASLRAKNLSFQLLTFAKGGLPVKETASLAQVIKESIDFTLRDRNVICHYSLPENLWPVDIDKGQINQVIYNLVMNACNAMPQGGTIEVSCRNIASDSTDSRPHSLVCNLVKMSIKDTGTGIAETLLDKIFDPYFSTKEQGTGLGLAISHSIVTSHGGQITVESAPGKGSTFTIYLPASPLGIESITEKKNTEQEAKKLRIMIMDDEKMIRDLNREMLTELGHDVLLAKDGKEALEIYKKAMDNNTPIDLTVMDLTIPGGMGGKEAVQKLLKIDPRAKVIVSSGYSNDPVMSDFKAHGFCATLSKPSRFKDFTDLINRLMTHDKD